MAFFTDKFLNDRREELLRSVDRFQYQLNGGAWQTGTVNSKEIIGTNVVVFVNAKYAERAGKAGQTAGSVGGPRRREVAQGHGLHCHGDCGRCAWLPV